VRIYTTFYSILGLIVIVLDMRFRVFIGRKI
jgi:hypothetical protein